MDALYFISAICLGVAGIGLAPAIKRKHDNWKSIQQFYRERPGYRKFQRQQNRTLRRRNDYPNKHSRALVEQHKYLESLKK